MRRGDDARPAAKADEDALDHLAIGQGFAARQIIDPVMRRGAPRRRQGRVGQVLGVDRLAKPSSRARKGQHPHPPDQLGQPADIAVLPLGIDQGRPQDGPGHAMGFAEGPDGRFAVPQPLNHRLLIRMIGSSLGEDAGRGKGHKPPHSPRRQRR